MKHTTWSVVGVGLFALGGCGGGDSGGSGTSTGDSSTSSTSTSGSTSASGSTSGGGGGGAPSSVPSVIMDVDAAPDDTSALAFLCQEQKLGHLKLKALTVVNNGVGYPSKGLQHMRCMLETCGITDVPTADGSDTGVNVAPTGLRDSVDQILSDAFQGCTQTGDPAKVSAAQLLVDSILAEKDKVTLMLFGPLTNVAAALKIDPTIKDRVASVHIMGGAVFVPGNIAPLQELNIWADPPSAQAVFQAFAPGTISLASLDATKFVPVTKAYLAKFPGSTPTAESMKVQAIMTHPNLAAAIDGGQLFWWDPLNAVATFHPEVVTYQTVELAVVQDGTAAGQTKETAGGAKVAVPTKADQQRFEDVFLATLTGKEASGK